MAATRGGASHTISGSEVTHTSNNSSSPFQAEIQVNCLKEPHQLPKTGWLAEHQERCLWASGHHNREPRPGHSFLVPRRGGN